MSMQTEKLEIIEMLLKMKDQTFIKQLKSYIEAHYPEADFWDELHDDVKLDVEEALAELERGEGIPHHEVMQKHEQWLKK